jgi:acyl carrier protein
VNSSTALDDVKSVLVETLGVEDRADSIDASTEVEGEDIGADVFETLGSLTAFVERKLA